MFLTGPQTSGVVVAAPFLIGSPFPLPFKGFLLLLDLRALLENTTEGASRIVLRAPVHHCVTNEPKCQRKIEKSAPNRPGVSTHFPKTPGQENLLLGHKLTRNLKQGELILLEDLSK